MSVIFMNFRDSQGTHVRDEDLASATLLLHSTTVSTAHAALETTARVEAAASAALETATIHATAWWSREAWLSLAVLYHISANRESWFIEQLTSRT